MVEASWPFSHCPSRHAWPTLIPEKARLHRKASRMVGRNSMDFGTFLLLQSPSARSNEEIYGRGVTLAQHADTLGFESVWCAEHHFSTYGYLSPSRQQD
jgi:hypothetical protein